MCTLVMLDIDEEMDQLFMEVDLEQQEPGNNSISNGTLPKSHIPLLAAIWYSTLEPRSELGEAPKREAMGKG